MQKAGKTGSFAFLAKILKFQLVVNLSHLDWLLPNSNQLENFLASTRKLPSIN